MNSSEKIGVFVDVISLHKNIKKAFNSKLDYRMYLKKLASVGNITRAYAYGAQIENEAHKFISFLKIIGFEPRYFRIEKSENQSNVQKIDRSIDLIIDTIRLIDKLDVVVIGSSNIRLLPFIRFLREKGIKIIIFSCNIPYPLKMESDMYWEINSGLLEQKEENEGNDNEEENIEEDEEFDEEFDDVDKEEEVRSR